MGKRGAAGAPGLGMTGCSHILPSPRGLGMAHSRWLCYIGSKPSANQGNTTNPKGKAPGTWGTAYLITNSVDMRVQG